MLADPARLLRELDRLDSEESLAGFIRRAWPVIEPATPYVHGWHIDAIAEHLEAITDGQITRLLINVPPGTMKSLCVGVFWPAWEWGPKNRPSTRVVATSHSIPLAVRDNLKARRLITSDWYQALWGDRVVLTGDQNAKTKFENTKTGFRDAMAFKSLTGSRGDRVIIDDPHSVDSAESEAERNSVTTTFLESVPTRLNSPRHSAIVVVMQRLHERDVSGVILSKALGYEHLMLPMEFEPERRCVTSIGFQDPRTEDGDLLFPERFPREVVERDKIPLGSYAVAGQFQQRPAPREGGLFKRHWFGIVRTAPAGCDWVRAWDLAASEAKVGKTSGQPAYTAGLLLGRSRDGQQFYIADVRRDRVSAGKLEEMLINTARQDAQNLGDGVRISLPQDPGGAGKFQAAYLVGKLIGFNARATPESGDKETRALPVSAQAEAGNITLIKGAWNDAFLDEVSSFPSGTFKDQVDALSRAFQELSGPSYGMLGVLD
ncbi:phage terminase large subunit [Methylobacterium tarhaniae]|uniref:phage terminase large subunit n=1 Tax=Methylobacterium tarhaniae TaxID=1187852 RepID=UPI003CFBD97A